MPYRFEFDTLDEFKQLIEFFHKNTQVAESIPVSPIPQIEVPVQEPQEEAPKTEVGQSSPSEPDNSVTTPPVSKSIYADMDFNADYFQTFLKEWYDSYSNMSVSSKQIFFLLDRHPKVKELIQDVHDGSTKIRFGILLSYMAQVETSPYRLKKIGRGEYSNVYRVSKVEKFKENVIRLKPLTQSPIELRVQALENVMKSWLNKYPNQRLNFNSVMKMVRVNEHFSKEYKFSHMTDHGQRNTIGRLLTPYVKHKPTLPYFLDVTVVLPPKSGNSKNWYTIYANPNYRNGLNPEKVVINSTKSVSDPTNWDDLLDLFINEGESFTINDIIGNSGDVQTRLKFLNKLKSHPNLCLRSDNSTFEVKSMQTA